MPLQKKIKYFIVVFSFILCVLLILNRRSITLSQISHINLHKQISYTYNFDLKRNYISNDPIHNIIDFIINGTNLLNIIEIDFSQNLKESNFFYDMLIFIYPKKYNPNSNYMICLDDQNIFISGENCTIYE